MGRRTMLLHQSALATILLLVILSLQGAAPFATVSRSAALRLHHGIPDRRLCASRKEDMVPPQPNLDGNNNNNSQNGANGDSNPMPQTKRRHFFTYIPRKVSKIYSEYLSRLWNETSVASRRKVAKARAWQSIRQVRNIFRNQEEYADVSTISLIDRQNLLDACDTILKDSKKADEIKESVVEAEDINDAIAVVAEAAKEQKAAEKKPKKKGRSVLFGAAMGAVAAAWVFSGNYVFTGLFTAMTILGQLEYYRMVMNTGVFPTRRLSVVGAASMFLTALFAPELHQICLPMFGLAAIVTLLADRHSAPHISDIATTFTGMFYLGYVPSFWVRIRVIGAGVIEPTRLAPIAAPVLAFLKQRADTKLPNFLPKAIHYPITEGSVFIFWSWLSLAFSDVGAYFVGRKFGKTKLGAVSAAAGATSPNKTVEGVIGGCLVSAALATFGAWVQKWPFWPITGAIHGLMLGFLGLIGDLTASMLKRDAGLKDFGDLIPEHGGILDRVDSFVWSAPYSWLMCSTILPALKALQ